MRPDGGAITDLLAGVMPFMGVYILAIVIMMVWPDVSLWLPRVARRGAADESTRRGPGRVGRRRLDADPLWTPAR